MACVRVAVQVVVWASVHLHVKVFVRVYVNVYASVSVKFSVILFIGTYLSCLSSFLGILKSSELIMDSLFRCSIKFLVIVYARFPVGVSVRIFVWVACGLLAEFLSECPPKLPSVFVRVFVRGCIIFSGAVPVRISVRVVACWFLNSLSCRSFCQSFYQGFCPSVCHCSCAFFCSKFPSWFLSSVL